MFPGVLALMHCAFSREVSGKWYYIEIEVRTHYECKQEQVLLVVLVVVPVVVVALRVD